MFKAHKCWLELKHGNWKTCVHTNQLKIDWGNYFAQREYERLVVEREAQLKQGETAFCITDLFLEEAARLVLFNVFLGSFGCFGLSVFVICFVMCWQSLNFHWPLPRVRQGLSFYIYKLLLKQPLFFHGSGKWPLVQNIRVDWLIW